MNKTKKTIFYLMFAFFSVTAVMVMAADKAPADAGFPIAQLGNCNSQAECKSFCDDRKNMAACVAYGESKGMITAQEARMSRRLLEKLDSGQTPGGCKDKAECGLFCQSNADNLEQCVAFGKETGALSGAELAQAEKVAAALKKGAKLPGGCFGKAECELYCDESAHIEECLNFAEAAQILPAAEIAEARKVMKFIASGETPGKCRTKDDCAKYCDEQIHFDECIEFAGKAGLISDEELAMAKKTGGKGPGGCKSKEECASYCDDPANAKACADYAIDKGLVTAEEAKMIKEGSQQLKSGLARIPAEARPEVETCLAQTIGSDNLAKLKSGQDVILTQKQGSGIAACFDKVSQIMSQKMMQTVPTGAPAGGSMPAGAPSGIQGQIPSGAAASSGSVEPSGAGAPAGAAFPTAGGSAFPAGAGELPSQPDASMCAQFKSAPSCDYVPAAVQDLCRKCR